MSVLARISHSLLRQLGCLESERGARHRLSRAAGVLTEAASSGLSLSDVNQAYLDIHPERDSLVQLNQAAITQ